MTQEQLGDDRVARAILALRRNPANRALQRHIYRMGDHELTPVQVDILDSVVREPGLTMKELAQVLGVDASTLSRTVVPLATLGLVEKRVDQGDARRARLVPTTAGLDQRAAIAVAAENAARVARAHLGAERWEQLADLLALYTEALEVAYGAIDTQ